MNTQLSASSKLMATSVSESARSIVADQERIRNSSQDLGAESERSGSRVAAAAAGMAGSVSDATRRMVGSFTSTRDASKDLGTQAAQTGADVSSSASAMSGSVSAMADKVKVGLDRVKSGNKEVASSATESAGTVSAANTQTRESYTTMADRAAADLNRVKDSTRGMGTDASAVESVVSGANTRMGSSYSTMAQRVSLESDRIKGANDGLGTSAGEAEGSVSGATERISGSYLRMSDRVKVTLGTVKSGNKEVGDSAQTASGLVEDANGRMRNSYGQFVSAVEVARRKNEEFEHSNATAAESNRSVIDKLRDRVSLTVGLTREMDKQRDKSVLLAEADSRIASSSRDAAAGEMAEAGAAGTLATAQSRVNLSLSDAARLTETYVQGLRREEAAMGETSTVMAATTASQVGSMELLRREASSVERSYAMLALAARDSANEQSRDIRELAAQHSLEAKLIIAENDRIIDSNRKLAVSRAAAERGVPEGDIRTFEGTKLEGAAAFYNNVKQFMDDPTIQRVTGQKRAFQDAGTEEEHYYLQQYDHFMAISGEKERAIALENRLRDATKLRQEADLAATRARDISTQSAKNAPTNNWGPLNPIVNLFSGGQGFFRDRGATAQLTQMKEVADKAQKDYEAASQDEQTLQSLKSSGLIRVLSDIDKEEKARTAAHKSAMSDLDEEQKKREQALSKSLGGAGSGILGATVNPIPAAGMWGMLAGPALPAAIMGAGVLGAAALPPLAFAGAAAGGLALGAYSMPGAEAANQLQTTGGLSPKQADALNKQITNWSVKYGTDATLAEQSATGLLDAGVPLDMVKAIMQPAMQSAGVTRTPVAAGASAGLSAFANYRPAGPKQAQAMMNAMFSGSAGDFTDVSAAAPTLFQQSAQMGVSLPAVMAMVDRMNSTGRSTSQSTGAVAGILTSIQGGMINPTQIKAAKSLGLDPSMVFGEDVGKMGGINAVIQRIDQAAINAKGGPGTVDQIMARDPALNRRQATAEQARLLSTNTDLQALMGGRTQAQSLIAIAGRNAQGTTLGQNIAEISGDKSAIADAAKIHDKSPMADFDKGVAGLKKDAGELGKLFVPVITAAMAELGKLATWFTAHKDLMKPVVSELKSLGHDFEQFGTWVTTGTRASSLQAFWKEVQTMSKNVGNFLGQMGNEFGKLGKPFNSALSEIKNSFGSFGGDMKNGQTAAKTFADILVGAIKFAAGIWDVEIHIIAGAVHIIEGVANAFKGLTDALGITSSKTKDSTRSTMDLMGELGKTTGIILAGVAAYKILHAAFDAGRLAIGLYRAAFIAQRDAAGFVVVESKAVVIWTNAVAGAQRLGAIATKLWSAEINAQTIATNVAKVATAAWGLAMDALPFIAIGLLIVGLVAGIIYMYNHVKWFRDFVNLAFADILKFAGWLRDGFVTGFKQLGSDLMTAIMIPINFLRNAWLTIYNFLIGHSLIPDLINGILNWFKSLGTDLVAAVTGMWDKVKGLFTGLVSWVKDNWMTALVLLFTGLPGLLIAGLIKFGPMIGTFLHDLSPTWLKGAEDWVGQMVSAVVKGASKLKDAVMTAIKDAIGAAGNWIKDHNPLGFLGGGGPSGSSGGGGWNGNPATLASSFGVNSQGFVNSGVEQGNVDMYKSLKIAFTGALQDWDYATKSGGQRVTLPGNQNTLYTFLQSLTQPGMGTADFFRAGNGGIVQTNHMQGAPNLTSGQTVTGGTAIGMSGEPTNSKYGTGWHLCIVTDANGREFLSALTDQQMNDAFDSASGLSLQVKNYSSDITAAAKKAGVPASVLASLIQQESGGNQRAVSSTGAIGLTQLEPATARQMGVNPYDAKSNIQGGAQYLASLVKSSGGNMKLALEGYNAGAGHTQQYYNTVRNGPGGITPAQYADQILNRVSVKGGFGGGGGAPTAVPNAWWQANKKYVPATQGTFSDATGKVSPGTAGHWVDKTAWEKTHYWIPATTSASAHEGDVSTVPGHWGAAAPPAYDLSIGKFAAVSALAATSPTHPAYDTVAQGKQGWVDMGTTQIPALTTSLAGLTKEVQKPLKVDIAKLAQQWENIGTKANADRASALATYQSKVKTDNADYAHKLSDVFKSAGIQETASKDNYVLAQKRVMDAEATHAATATEANRHALADFNLKQNENNTKYLSQQEKLVSQGGESSKQAEANLAKTYGISTKTAAALFNESALHQGQNQAIYSAKEKNTFDELAAHLGVHNSTMRANLEKHVADLKYNDSKKTAGDWAAYQKQLGKIDQVSLSAENSLQAAIVAERAKIAAAQTPEARYKAEGAHLQNVINKQTAIGIADDRYGVTGPSLDTAISKTIAANAKLQQRQDAQDKFAYQTATTSAETVPYLTSQVIKMLTAGTTGGRVQTGRNDGTTPSGGTVLDADIAGLAKAFNDAQAAADIVAKKDYLVAVAAGDAAGQVNYLQGEINKLSSQHLAALNLAVLSGTGDLVALTQAVITDEQAAKKHSQSLDIARTSADAINGDFNALSGDLSKMSGIIQGQVLTDLMQGHGLNQDYLNGMIKLRDIQLTMTQVTSGLDAVLSASEGDLTGMSSAINSLTGVSLAHWQQALVNGAGVQNQYSAELVKEAAAQRLVTIATYAQDYALGQMTGDVTKVNSALSGFLNMALSDMDRFIVNIGRVDDTIPKTGDSLSSLAAVAIKAALNLGTMDDIIAGLQGTVDKTRQGAEKEFLTTGTISPDSINAYKSALTASTSVTWNKVAADNTLYQKTGQVSEYYQNLGNEINLQVKRVNELGVSAGTNSEAYKTQFKILGDLRQQYAGLGFWLDNAQNGTKLNADQTQLATWAMGLFTSGAISPADAALKGMTSIVIQSGIDTAQASKDAAAATKDLGDNATKAATALLSMVQPITDLVTKINGINTVAGAPVTVTGAPVIVTGGKVPPSTSVSSTSPSAGSSSGPDGAGPTRNRSGVITGPTQSNPPLVNPVSTAGMSPSQLYQYNNLVANGVDPSQAQQIITTNAQVLNPTAPPEGGGRNATGLIGLQTVAPVRTVTSTNPANGIGPVQNKFGPIDTKPLDTSTKTAVTLLAGGTQKAGQTISTGMGTGAKEVTMSFENGAEVFRQNGEVVARVMLQNGSQVSQDMTINGQKISGSFTQTGNTVSYTLSTTGKTIGAGLSDTGTHVGVDIGNSGANAGSSIAGGGLIAGDHIATGGASAGVSISTGGVSFANAITGAVGIGVAALYGVGAAIGGIVSGAVSQINAAVSSGPDGSGPTRNRFGIIGGSGGIVGPNAQGLWPNQIVNDPNANNVTYPGGNNPGYIPPPVVGPPPIGPSPVLIGSSSVGAPPLIGGGVGSGGTITYSNPPTDYTSISPIPYVPPDNTSSGGMPTDPYANAGGGGGGGGGGGTGDGMVGGGGIIQPTTGDTGSGTTGTAPSTGVSLVPVPTGDSRGPNAVLTEVGALATFVQKMQTGAGPAILTKTADDLKKAGAGFTQASLDMIQTAIQGGKNNAQIIDAAKVQIQAEMDVIQANYANAQSTASSSAMFGAGVQQFGAAVQAFGAAQRTPTQLPTGGPVGTVVSGPGGVAGVVGASAMTLDPRADKALYNKQFALYTSQGWGVSTAEHMAYVDAMEGAMWANQGSQPLNPWSRDASGAINAVQTIDPRAAAEAFVTLAMTGIADRSTIVNWSNNGNGYVVANNIAGTPVIPGLDSVQASNQVQTGLAVNWQNNQDMLTGSGIYSTNPDGSPSGGLVAQNMQSWFANGGLASLGLSPTGNTGKIVPVGPGQFAIVPQAGDVQGAAQNYTATVNPATGYYTVYDTSGKAVDPSSLMGYNWLGGTVGSLGAMQGYTMPTPYSTGPLLNSQYNTATMQIGAQYGMYGFGTPGTYSPLGTASYSGVASYSGSPVSGTSSTQGYFGGGYAGGTPLGGTSGGFKTSAGGSTAAGGFDTGYTSTGSSTTGTTSGTGYENDPIYIKLKAMLDRLNAIEANTASTSDNTASLADIKIWLKGLTEIERTSADRQIGGATNWGQWFDNLGIAGVGMLAGGAT